MNKDPEWINTYIPKKTIATTLGWSLPIINMGGHPLLNNTLLENPIFWGDSKTNGKPMENQWVQSISHTNLTNPIFGFAALFLGGEYLMDLDLPGGWLWNVMNSYELGIMGINHKWDDPLVNHETSFATLLLKVNKNHLLKVKKPSFATIPMFPMGFGGVASIWEIIGSEIKPENIIQPVEALRLTEHSMAPPDVNNFNILIYG